MRAVLAALFASALCVPGLSASLKASPPQDADDPREEQYPRWIADLGHEDLEVRDRASHCLARAGRNAWPALERATTNDDPEIRARAISILETSRRRRQISHRLLRDHPNALSTLEGGNTVERVRLIRAMSANYEEAAPFLRRFLHDSDGEVVVAAAEALHENRQSDWVPALLEVYAREDCPRVARVQELLGTVSTLVHPESLKKLIESADACGRTRLVELATTSSLRLEIPKPILHTMLEDCSTTSVHAALGWIRDRAISGFAPDLEMLLDSSSPSIVSETLLTLRRLHYPAEVDRVRKLVAHEDAAVREEALEYLGNLDGPEAADAAHLLLDDPSTAVRRAAIAMLWKIRGNDALGDTLGVYFEDAGEQRELAASYLLRHRDWARPRVHEAFESEDPDKRIRAAELLGRLEGHAIFYEAAKDRNDSVRHWALRRILCLEDSASNEALVTLSQDRCEEIRFDALKGLVRRGKKQHVDALAEFLKSKEHSFRIEAAETLFDYGSDKIPALARQQLDDPDAQIRRLALSALADHSVFGETGTALKMLDDPEPRLRQTAVQYLSQAMTQSKNPEIVQLLAGRLETLTDESYGSTFQLVLNHGDARARDTIRRLVVKGRAPNLERALRSLAQWSGDKALEELVSFLGDDPAMNDTVFQRIGELRGISSDGYHARLRQLLKHPDPRVRGSAARAVGELQTSPLIPDLARLLSDLEAEVRYCALMSFIRLSHFEPEIVNLLDDEDPDIREKSAGAVLRLRPDLRATVERAAAREDCPWVKRRVEELLKDSK